MTAEPGLAGGRTQDTGTSYELKYRVLRDGAPIGTYIFNIRENGQTYNFEARLDIKVTVLGFTVYELRHRRSEQWRGDTLISLQGYSVYDEGDRYQIDLERVDAQNYTLKVNDHTQELEGRVISFSPRQPGDWQKAKLISLKGNADTITQHNLGSTELRLHNTTYRAAHYRTKGDVTRDLWYDDKGRLLRLAYDDEGARITFRRMTANAPQ